MKFGISKCAVVSLKRGKRANVRGVELPSGESMGDPDDEGYKYLGVLEIDDILHTSMKENVRSTYLKRLKLVLKSKLNAKNLILAINTWAVSVIRYSAGILNWNKEDRDGRDRNTRQLMTMPLPGKLRRETSNMKTEK